MTLSTGPWWCAPVLALGWITTVPAQSFSAPARAWVIAAARFMPGVCAVLMSSSFERSEEHTSELQSHRDLHSFPTRRSSDLHRPGPEFLGASARVGDRRGAVHAGRLRRVDVELVRVHDAHAVVLPLGIRTHARLPTMPCERSFTVKNTRSSSGSASTECTTFAGA